MKCIFNKKAMGLDQGSNEYNIPLFFIPTVLGATGVNVSKSYQWVEILPPKGNPSNLVGNSSTLVGNLTAKLPGNLIDGWKSFHQCGWISYHRGGKSIHPRGNSIQPSRKSIH